jgi:hypothetical protein
VAALLLAVHLVKPIAVVPPANDRITRQAAKADLARRLAAELPHVGDPAPVFSPTYQWTALLRFHHIDARQIDGFSRPSHFTQTPERPADQSRFYVFAEGFLPDRFVPGFGLPRMVAKYPLLVRGQEVAVFWLLEYARPDAAAGTAGSSAAAGRLDRGP